MPAAAKKLSAEEAQTSRRPTLRLVFTLASLVILLMLAVLFYVFVEGSRRSLLQSSDKARQAAARRVAREVTAEIHNAQNALENVERDIVLRVVDTQNLLSVEAALFSEMVDNPSLSELSFTMAKQVSFNEEGEIQLAPGERAQVALQRPFEDNAGILTQQVEWKGGKLVGHVRKRGPGAGLQAVPFTALEVTEDPTSHPTFQTTASEDFRGDSLWSDLHYSQTDSEVPGRARRVIVTVQKAIEDRSQQFVGVLRVGILTHQLDELVHVRVAEDDPHDPHIIFVGDAKGRLITRLLPGSTLHPMEGELRVDPREVPAPVAAAMRSPVLAGMAASDEVLEASGRQVVAGKGYLMSFVRLPLPTDREWILGVLVPEDYYTRDLEAVRREFLLTFLAVLLVLLGVGGFTLSALRRGLGSISAGTTRIRQFDFSATQARAWFRDVDDVLKSLERAKTVMRALGKYVPVDLVRQQFEANREPHLGGQLQELSIMFTDIKGFTSLAETLTPDALAQKLGAYLGAMASTILEHQGVVDKFIGDAVMAMWNAPVPVPNHAHKACSAALACIASTKKLYASPEWAGLEPLHTRFGIHKDTVMVGHFGAPERMSFTALGDGVNLASRLESLCKQYGISIMVSETVAQDAAGAFEFRLLDVVAVKGKKKGVKVFELLCRKGEGTALRPVMGQYEYALGLYFNRKFAEAQALLVTQLHDPPSGVLAQRCAWLQQHPPAPDWDGTHTALSK